MHEYKAMLSDDKISYEMNIELKEFLREENFTPEQEATVREIFAKQHVSKKTALAHTQ